VKKINKEMKGGRRKEEREGRWRQEGREGHIGI
jgi:hypothetical protein